MLQTRLVPKRGEDALRHRRPPPQATTATGAHRLRRPPPQAPSASGATYKGSLAPLRHR